LKISDLEQNKRIAAERLAIRTAKYPAPDVIVEIYQGEQVSRNDAKAAGMLRFFTGVPCRKGHIDQQLVSNRICMECDRIRANEAHRRNPEAHGERSRTYRLNNLEKVRISTRVHCRNRRAVKRNADGKHTNAEINILHAAQQGRCANPVCGKVLGNTYHADHIVALINGGTNWISNIQLLCPTCNLRKGRKDYSQFVAECLERLAAQTYSRPFIRTPA
jgi:5-methylcytosine-specific restriction endonuclease McrA